MAYPSDFKSAVENAAVLNLELIRRYRDSAHGIRNPAVGRLVQSVLDQKASQADLLRAVVGSGDPGRDSPALRETVQADPPSAPSAPEPGADPTADLLRMVRSEEEGLGALFEGLREAAADEENRGRLHSLSETSRKIGEWARDHLELLSLY
jgi:hypothetical protein